MDRSQEKGTSSKAKLQTLDQGMGIPYMANPNMDPRAFSSFLYGYNSQMIGFPGYAGIVYGQRLANGEDMRENRSSTSTPADRSDSSRDPKEPIRTESVIKIATDRSDSRKQDPIDKRQSRPSSDEHTRQYADRNGEMEASRNMNIYRGPRDKLDGPMNTPNGDLRNTTSKQMPETSNLERTIGAFNSYQAQSVYSKSLTPVSHPGDYVQKSDYSKTVTTSSNMYSSMPKLTPIAPRGFSSNFPATSAAEVTERQSMSGSVWRPPNMGYSQDYPLTSASEALVSHRSSTGENTSRAEETPEARGSYLPHPVHESNARSQENFARHFPYTWDRNTAGIASRYHGHSAYPGYGYGRTFQPKRSSEKENFKETEEVRSRASDSVKESSISPDRSTPRYPKDASKAPSAESNRHKEQSGQNYKSTATTQDVSSRNQTSLIKNEKPVVAENVRYKVKDERKSVLKSDKVTVYPRQGMAYVVSVRETPQNVSDYFSNGRLPNADITAVSSESNDRNQLPSGYETASKKDDGQRHGSIREGAVKGTDKISPEVTPGGDYPRRTVDTSNTDRSTSEETKKINDRNNNSSFGAYQYPGYPSQSERPRASNRITLSQDKVFVPPNATLEMFEKRELEMERAAASCRSGETARSGQFGPNVRQKPPGRKENEQNSRNHSPDQTNPRITSSKNENKGSRSDISSKSSDDEELKIIEEKTDNQQRSVRSEEKRSSSSPRLSRITSPAATTSSSTNPPYLTPFGVNFPRRNPSDSDAAARESNERNLQAAAYMYGANIPYQTGSPYLGSNVRPDMQVMMPVDSAMFYNSLYKQHMMDPSQGGAVMQDPLTGSLVVVPEAMINPNMFSPLAAESQLMLDSARFWNMQASMEDPRWQIQKQIYEQQMEKYKHEMMIAQQQGRWPGYSVHPFYQKQMEAQRKEENERSLRTSDQRPKSREDQSNQPRADKPEDSTPKEKKSTSTEERFFHESRRDDSDSRKDSSKDFQGESRGVTSYPEKEKVSVPVKPVKPPSIEYSEAREKAKEILQQEEQDRLFQQYMLREPVFNPSKFPFTRIPTSLSTPSSNPKSPLDVPRDRVRDLRENSRGESTQNSETRAEMSPQVVSAAATLANMDFGTRFPFNQQSSMSLDNSKISRGAEQLETSSKRSLPNQNISRDLEENVVYQSPAIRKSPTDNRPPQPIAYTSQQTSFSSMKTITAATVAPTTTHERREHTHDSSTNEKQNFDVLKSSFTRETTRTTSNSSQKSVKTDYLSNDDEECSRLLVAKAEKLPEDEELEVIRIDTPYACPHSDPDISTGNKQETDLLMSLAKASNEALESPSSKSEIFWVACSDEELEDTEVRTINSSAKPKELVLDGHNKENYFKLSLQNAKTEDEKKCIREKIEKLREVAKNRTREERFTALTRQKELKSPASIVHSVTSSLNEVLDMNVLEKDIRMRLADLQKKYREKHRELARLQPRCKEGNDDTSGKNTPVKRGPGRPRKRKYFGASSRSGKTTPTLTSNGSLDLANRSGASSPSSCPQSPGLKSVTSEDNPTVKEEPVKKKRKKSSTNNKVEERVPTLPSPPQIVSPTELELKPPRVKPSKKTPNFTPKTRIPTPTINTTSSTASNMAKLISAISPSMLDDSSNVETENESNTTDFKTLPTKPKPKRTKKLIRQEKIPSTDESVEDKGKMSPDSAKELCGSPTSINLKITKKVKNPKKSKKKEKQATPKTNTEFVFPTTGENVVEKTVVKQEFPKIVGAEIEKKVERESNGDSSENDEVFAACRGGGALDMLADFASSASFEKEKDQAKRESPFEGLGKGSKRGRPKKPSSPTPESDSTPTPKKKKKKKKPSTSSTKSSKKSSTTSEEKENDFTNREIEQQSPTQIPQLEKTELKEQPKPEVLEEQIEKVPELRDEPEEDEPEVDPEPDALTPPEPIKEKRRKSRSSSVKELDDSKSAFALFGDWQPRRSERIFINSSVAPPSNADLSPLSSPTVKTSDLGWPKKTKRLSKGKKLSKTDSVSDVEPTEDEAPPTSSKITTRPKKKKSPAKGKKRRSSSVTDPDFVLRTPKRKAAKRDRSYEEADEDEDEDMADEEEEDYIDDIEETEQTSKENHDETLEEDSQPHKPENDVNDAKDFELNDEESTNISTSNSGAVKSADISSRDKENDDEIDTVCEKTSQENTGLETVKKETQKDAEKEEGSAKKGEEDKKDKLDGGKESMEEMEKTDDDKEASSRKEKQGKEEQEKDSGAGQRETLPCDEKPASEKSKDEESSSDELALVVSKRRKELPPEPVISFTKEELKENAKMLLPVDRVFYRGRIAFYQDPDLYGIVLPGERGRRPHLRSTEQLLSQAVKDVIPPAVEYLPIGTRVCAHWSPQYRCFYPGGVIETPPDEKSEVGKLWVEFDDGDSGIFPLSDLRKIKTQYPVQVEDVESDVVVPERRPRSSSRAASPSSTRRSRDHETSLKIKDEDTSGWDSSEDAPIKKSKGRGKRRVRLRTRDRRLSEEATDSDAPRGSRDSDFEDNVETSKRDSRTKVDNDKDYEVESKPSQSKGSKRERRRIKYKDDINTSSQDKSKETTKHSETSETAKRDLKGEKSGNKDRDKSKSNSNVQKHQEEDSDACDDNEGTQEAGTSRSRSRSSRLSELDLRKKSLTLNLNSSSSLRLGNLERDSPMQDSTSQDEDSGSCSEVFDESPQTENKAFQPRLGKRRRSQLDKLRQDKSQGELWQWSGKNYQNKRKGKGRKVFYKTIVRGDETISVGDCAVFTSNPSKSHNLPYVGMIENMWEGCGGNMVVKVKWFYHPEETKAGRRASDAKHSLYRSTHVDENDVQTISHKCEVVTPEELKRRTQETIGTRSSTSDRSERLFCCVGTYDPSTEKIEST